MLVLALASAGIGCARIMMGGAYMVHSVGSGSPPPVPVPELDDLIMDASGLEPSSGKTDVRSTLGDPPFVTELRTGAGELWRTTWWYPIRDMRMIPLPDTARAQTRVVTAAVLRVSLDSLGHVKDWGFVHPTSGEALPFVETADQARAWLERLHDSPPRIELAAALRQGTPREEVLKAMHWHDQTIHSSELDRIQVRSLTEGSQELLVFYADRPSPYYIPPDYLVVRFSEIGDMTTSWHFQSW